MGAVEIFCLVFATALPAVHPGQADCEFNQRVKLARPADWLALRADARDDWPKGHTHCKK
jgi:hypothetical protein